MKNYELRIHLQYLTPAGKNKKGELEWIGTNEEWDIVESYLLERAKVVESVERKKEYQVILDTV